jgi:hypothetical protein
MIIYPTLPAERAATNSKNPVVNTGFELKLDNFTSEPIEAKK